MDAVIETGDSLSTSPSGLTYLSGGNLHRLAILLGILLLTSCSGEVPSDVTDAISEDAKPMRIVVYEHEIGVPANAAWVVFADFGAFAEWNALPISLELDGQGVGMTRTMDIPGIGRVSERLDQLDHANRTLAYSLVEGTPLNMAEYRAEVTLIDAGEDQSLIQWRGEFTGQPGVDPDEIADNLTLSYKGMSEALAAFVGQRT